jgi:hypothetical protein
MAFHVKSGGSWQQPKSIFVNQGGSWTTVKKLWINDGGTWKQVAPNSGIQTFTAAGVTHTLTIPRMVTTIYLTGIGGGGGAGNMVDGGYNDDSGASGGGGSGQRIINYPIAVTPLETISIVIGDGGGNAGTARGTANRGGSGGTTSVSCSSGTYYLYGGAGGYGGEGFQGARYPGGTTSLSNGTISGVTATNGAHGNAGSTGGAGFVDANGTLGPGRTGGSYGNGGSTYHYELDATEYGGGGAGAYFGYIREDNGNHPGWCGKGKSGLVTISW